MGDSLALCPPLVIAEVEIDELFDRLLRALDRTHRELVRRGMLAEPAIMGGSRVPD